jgi:hexokinase
MKKIEQFLAENGLSAEAVDAETLIRDFISEMENGLSGNESSLAMIPTYISADMDIPVNELVIVIDAGGTNLRVASIVFDDDRRARIDDFSNYPMPGSEKEVLSSEFFQQLAGYIRPFLYTSSKIGFCFSYPAEISPERDGRLIKWTKELKSPDVVGRYIGKGLLDALGAEGAGKSVVLLNDTIATLLAGKAAAGNTRYGSYIGFILGTGTNIAYLEKNENILKLSGLDPYGTQAINVESGSFSKAPRSRIDILMDNATEGPGSQPFEKMISGRYLPKIALSALRQGALEEVFSAPCSAWINGLKDLTHEQIDDLIQKDKPEMLNSSGFNDIDQAAVRSVMSAVIQRAAKLSAVNIAAAVLKAIGKSERGPVCINIEGSAYYKTAGLRENTEKHVKYILGPQNIRYEFVHADRSSMIGAAIAGLVN